MKTTTAVLPCCSSTPVLQRYALSYGNSVRRGLRAYRLLGIGSLTHAIDRFIGGQHRMSDKLVIDYRRLVAITPYRMPRSSGCVLDDCNLETLFDKVAQMGLDTHVRQHATEDD